MKAFPDHPSFATGRRGLARDDQCTRIPNPISTTTMSSIAQDSNAYEAAPRSGDLVLSKLWGEMKAFPPRAFCGLDALANAHVPRTRSLL